MSTVKDRLAAFLLLLMQHWRVAGLNFRKKKSIMKMKASFFNTKQIYF